MNKTLHIVITGGHHNSALVVARELIKSGIKVTWLGHKQASYGDQNDSAEYVEVKNAGITFHDLRAGKFSLHAGLTNLINIPLGIIRSLHYLSKLKPDAVLSFGGYLGFAAGISSFILQIPLYLHEQTVTSGLANTVLGRLSRRVFLTWESSQKQFPPGASQLVGLPLRESLFSSPTHKLFSNQLPTILILGGKQGAHVINQLIFRHLPDLLAHYNLIHQTGTSSVTADYEQALAQLDSLSPDLASRYQPHGYISENEIGGILRAVNFYLGRSGAHITYELGVLGIRSLLIPYLHTHQKEQLLNARVLENAGLAVILPQSQLSFPNLQKALKQVNRLSGKPLSLPREAARNMVQSLLTDLG